MISKYHFDCCLKYFKNDTLKGSPGNWNESIKYASGQYIKMLHHDDWFSYDYSLEQFVYMLDNNPCADFGFSCAFSINEKEKSKKIHRINNDQLKILRKPKKLFYSNFIGPPSSTIFRKGIGIEYNRELKWVVDLDFYIRVLNKNNKFAFCSKPLICSINNAKHNITNECNVKEIDLYEHIYIYNKHNVNYFPSYKDYIFFTQMFYRYNISAYRDLKDLDIKYGKLKLLFSYIFIIINIKKYIKMIIKVLIE